MIKPYNLEANSSMNLILGNMMKNTFFFLIIFITIWIFISLIIWQFGSRIKSEKTIKFGIKNLAISIFIEFFTLLIPVFISFIL